MKDKFIRGVGILLISGVIAKVLGAIFRIPLTWVLGIDGLGLYQLIYPVFALLIVLSSSGMPTAISKLVATKVKEGNYVGANQVLKVACVFFGAISFVFGVLLFMLAEQISSIQGNTLSIWGYKAIAPAIFVVSFLSCLRGYFQGMNNMVPTAISQIIEQGGKLILGLLLAWLLLPFGVEFATSGALLGVTLSEVFATITLFIIYKKQRKKSILGQKSKFRLVLSELVRVALPIIVSSVILPILAFVDSFLVVNLLMKDFPVDVSTQLWGVSSGVVTSLINFPIALSLSVAVSVVPQLVGKQNDERKKLLNKAFELILLISIPAAIFLCVLSRSVIATLYGMNFVLADKTLLAVRLLSFSAPLVVLGSILQTQTSSLQAVGSGGRALITMLLAGLMKVVLTIILVRVPSLNIWGFTIANFAFYLLAVGINVVFIHKKIGYSAYFQCVKKILPAILLLTLVLLNVLLLNVSDFVKIILGLTVGGGGYIFSLLVFDVDIKFLNLRRMSIKNSS